MRSTDLDQLGDFLKAVTAGPVTDTSTIVKLEALVAACWESLKGEDGGMTNRKLSDRMEDISWDPPLLSFTIERHGGTVLGSTRAELQRWIIDVNQASASCRRGSYRQLYPMSPRLDVTPLAKRVVSLILAEQDDDCLKWRPGRSRVTIRTGKIIPAEGTPKQTLQGRRKRLAKELRTDLEERGWRLVQGTTAHTYEKVSEQTDS